MSESRKQNYELKKIVKSIFYIGVIVFLLFLVFKYETNKNQGRDILHHAKLIRLVAQNAYFDFQTQEKIFYDNNRKALTSEAEKEILHLTKYDGKIYCVKFEADSFRVSRLVYMEKGYIVEFTDSEENPQWTVYRLEKIID